jgi:hypothetical protein
MQNSPKIAGVTTMSIQEVVRASAEVGDRDCRLVIRHEISLSVRRAAALC